MTRSGPILAPIMFPSRNTAMRLLNLSCQDRNGLKVSPMGEIL